MAVDFEWDDDEHTIMRLTTTESWDWAMFHRALRRAALRYDDVDHRVELIIDFSQTDVFPAGAIAHIRSLGTAFHPNAPARAVIIGVSSDMQRGIGAKNGVLRDAQRMLRFAQTMDEAKRIIERWRADKDGG